MLDGYFRPFDLILNEKILYLDMLSPLRTACPPVGLKQDSTHVVLVEQGWISISYFTKLSLFSLRKMSDKRAFFFFSVAQRFHLDWTEHAHVLHLSELLGHSCFALCFKLVLPEFIE